MRAGNLSTNTRDWYLRMLDTHVIATHGSVRVSDVTPSTVERWVDLDRAGSTRRGVYLALRQALELAVRDGLVARNVARQVKGPRADSESPEVADEHDTELLLKAAADLAEAPNCKAPMVVPIAILVWTGMRRVELLGLRWADVTDDTIRIRISKTRAGKRSVPIAKALRPYLVDRGRPDDYVVANRDDPTSPRDARAFSRSFALVADRAGVDRSPHTLRHGLATRLMLEGTPPQVVAAILGHASTRLLDVYAHSNPAAERAAIDALGGGDEE